MHSDANEVRMILLGERSKFEADFFFVGGDRKGAASRTLVHQVKGIYWGIGLDEGGN